jgi:hydrogenase maturation protease
MSLPRKLVVGIGSPHGDDQAGWRLAERLAIAFDQDNVVVRKAKSPSELLDWLDGIERLIVCDACRGLGRVGEIKRWTWPASELQQASWSGTHDLSLPAVLQLADRLGRLPPTVVVWSVEGASVEALGAMSSHVAAALPNLADQIANEVNEGSRCTNVLS